jgi:serine/threonine protein kinase
MIGQKINNYVIESLLGEGGMGNVYLAEDKEIGRKVAVKAILPHLAKNDHVRDRFMNELKTMSRLNHDNIVKMHEYVANEHGLYLIMEYVDGLPLDDYIQKLGKPLEEDLAIEITKQVVSACSHAHSKGIVHRDIKPGNIMITKDNTVKILDFGIAKIVNEEVSKLTKTGLQVGTVYYMAPEQVQGHPITFQTDIYSIGVTLYQMVTMENPYKDFNTEFQIYKKIIDEPLPNVQKKNSQLTVFIDKVIQKATRKKPEERFSDCEQFLKVLEDKEWMQYTNINPQEARTQLHQQAPSYQAPQPQPTTQSTSSSVVQENLPNASGALVCGLLGLIFSIWGFLGIIGLILSIIGVSLGAAAKAKYQRNPEKYRKGSYSNANAGMMMGIIGICLFVLVIIILIAALSY